MTASAAAEPEAFPEISARPWRRDYPPRRILAIRIQATGDTVITLPYLRGVRALFPDSCLDFLTLEGNAGIPRSLVLFDQVFGLGGGRNEPRQLLAGLLLVPALVRQKYEVVLDLQNSRVSRVIRRCLRPHAWSEFDRFSPRPAGERTCRTIRAAGIPAQGVFTPPVLKHPSLGLDFLSAASWTPGTPLVVLNPAGAFSSRNWPLDNYVSFAGVWRARFAEPVRFLLLGIPELAEKAGALAARIGPDAISLVGRTSLAEAFTILQRATLVLSEDSGLMHMAWTSGIPTIALLGSTRGDWARPLGKHSVCLDSADLECGYCMDAVCRFGDTHCLTRHSPTMVVELALGLLDRCRRRAP